MSWRHSIKALAQELTLRCTKDKNTTHRDNTHHIIVANTLWRMVVLLYLRAHTEVELIVSKLPADIKDLTKSTHGVHGVYITAGNLLNAYHCCYRNPDITDSQLDIRSCREFMNYSKKATSTIIFSMHDLPPRDGVTVPDHVTIMYAKDYNAPLMTAIVKALSSHLLTTQDWSRPKLVEAMMNMRREQHSVSFTEQDGEFTEPHYVTHSQLKTVVKNKVLSVQTP